MLGFQNFLERSFLVNIFLDFLFYLFLEAFQNSFSSFLCFYFFLHNKFLISQVDDQKQKFKEFLFLLKVFLRKNILLFQQVQAFLRTPQVNQKVIIDLFLFVFRFCDCSEPFCQ